MLKKREVYVDGKVNVNNCEKHIMHGLIIEIYKLESKIILSYAVCPHWGAALVL